MQIRCHPSLAGVENVYVEVVMEVAEAAWMAVVAHPGSVMAMLAVAVQESEARVEVVA